MPPPRQRARAPRAAQPPRRQPPLDHACITVYRDHRCLRAPRAALPPPRPRERREGRRQPERDHGGVAHEKGQPIRVALQVILTANDARRPLRPHRERRRTARASLGGSLAQVTALLARVLKTAASHISQTWRYRRTGPHEAIWGSKGSRLTNWSPCVTAHSRGRQRGPCLGGTIARWPPEPFGKSADGHEVGARLRAHFARGCSVVLGRARPSSFLTWADEMSRRPG